MSPGDRLRTYAEFRFGSIAALARLAGIRKQQMHGYTSGENAPGLEILIRLQETGLNLNWLANGKGSMILLEAGTAADRAAECERVLEEIVAKVEEYRAATEEIEVLRPSEMLTQEIIDIDDLQESPKRGSKREKVKK